jgi:hypothetical protein
VKENFRMLSFPSLKNLEYTDRLKKLKMPTLKYRRLRGDMIETFKIINGIYDRDVTEGLLDLHDKIRKLYFDSACI